MHIKRPEKYREKRFDVMLERLVDYLLLGIENRGKHATGFVCFRPDGSMLLRKKDVTAREFVTERDSLLSQSRTVLLHTRFATQGEPDVWANNHPVFFGDWFTVHNGTIYNDATLFKKHDLERVAEVDSEVIPAMLDKYGLENAHQAFEELSGGFATASVNFKAPNTTVLAKGGTWPLVTLETKDILVFASTKKAIEDAWGSVLGTPPTSGWEELGSGDIWIVEGNRVTKKPKAFKHSSYRTATSTRSSVGVTWADDWDQWDDEEVWPHTGDGNRQYILDRSSAGGTRRGGAEIVLDTKERVAELRKSGKGACVTYSQRLTEKGKKYLDQYGNNTWAYCVHCEVSVADPQMVKGTRDYGDICLDCYVIAKQTYPENDGNLNEFLDEIGIRNDDFETLVKFSDTEVYIHNQALYWLARKTGIKRTTLDWLLHRADENVLSQSDTLLKLYTEVADLYFEKSMELWQTWSVDEVKGEPDPWVTCASGTHKQSEECEACKAADAAGESCGVQAFEEVKLCHKDGCTALRAANSFFCVAHRPKPANLKDDDEGVVIYDSASSARDKCLLCRRKPTFFLGLTHAWCTRHKHKCAEKGCKEVANGYLPDGTRYCHVHSRGKKGLVTDNDYKARRALAHA